VVKTIAAQITTNPIRDAITKRGLHLRLVVGVDQMEAAGIAGEAAAVRQIARELNAPIPPASHPDRLDVCRGYREDAPLRPAEPCIDGFGARQGLSSSIHIGSTGHHRLEERAVRFCDNSAKFPHRPVVARSRGEAMAARIGQGD
jgi:hypothetical protein